MPNTHYGFEKGLMPPRIRRWVLILIAASGLLWLKTVLSSDARNSNSSWSLFPSSSSSIPPNYESWGPFTPMEIPGFANTGRPEDASSCDSLTYTHTVGVQKSFFLEDDLQQIAADLDSHPLVTYPDELTDSSGKRPWDQVRPFWERMAGSSVWLSDQAVFLLVSRVVFFLTAERQRSKMSFLRGQLFSADWEPLENYDITWGDTTVTFPLVFDVPAPTNATGVEFGPEDPRIIRKDAESEEPVIVFNMLAPHSTDWKRAMYAFRPFSGTTTLLTIHGQEERSWTEKNWAPFFLHNGGATETVSSDQPATPELHRDNESIHFVYSFRPLRILKCHLRTGRCETVHEQTLDATRSESREDSPIHLRGGTNFVPVPLPARFRLRPGVKAWLSLPRTNDPTPCAEALYRPETVVMVSIDDVFHIGYASSSLEFGEQVVELEAGDDPCDVGRRMIPNSIPRWDIAAEGQDVMSITLSVDDASVQVLRVMGFLELIWDLPEIWALLSEDGRTEEYESEAGMQRRLSDVAEEVYECSVRSAQDLGTAKRKASDLLKGQTGSGVRNELVR